MADSKDKDILLKAFETARAWSGLLVTLSSAGIVFTAIFRRDFASQSMPLEQTHLLLGAWIALGVAATMGVGFLGALTAILNKGSASNLDVYTKMNVFLGISQLAAFIAGVVLVILFAYLNMT